MIETRVKSNYKKYKNPCKCSEWGKSGNNMFCYNTNSIRLRKDFANPSSNELLQNK